MKIIDFHTHIYPHKIAEKAVSSVGEFYNLKMQGEGTAENLLKQGEKHNISNFVVHSVAVTPSHVQTINDYIANNTANFMVLAQCTQALRTKSEKPNDLESLV